MTAFINPRTNPDPSRAQAGSRTTSDPERLRALHQFCRESRLYEVEDWIRDGKPLQLSEDAETPRGRWSTALEITLDRGDHALTHLLLCNRYDPNLEPWSPLDAALHDKRLNLLDLLLDWGADPHDVDLDDLFGTYDSKLFGRFRDMGVDLADGHAIARYLAEHSSHKPLFGFVKRHLPEEPSYQVELNAALAYHAAGGNEKGVALCLWAGADPHAPAPILRYPWRDEDPDSWRSAIHEACDEGEVEILKRLGPDPGKDDFDDLYRAAETKRVVQYLLDIRPPSNPDELILHHLTWALFEWRFSIRWEETEILECLFEHGLRWQECSKDEIANLRRSLIKASDRTFVDLMKLLAKEDYAAREILHELARTPAMHRRMREVGFLPRLSDDPESYGRMSPTRSREVVKKFGAEPPKKKEPLPRTVNIGWGYRKKEGIRLTRRALFKRVWTEPPGKVAASWGISTHRLRSHCEDMKIPLPGRGYWPQVRAGKKPKKPRLPRLPKGQAEKIVVWMPGE